jgi:hypothetical protein
MKNPNTAPAVPAATILLSSGLFVVVVVVVVGPSSLFLGEEGAEWGVAIPPVSL